MSKFLRTLEPVDLFLEFLHRSFGELSTSLSLWKLEKHRDQNDVSDSQELRC